MGPGEQAVIRTFGRETGKAGPGLHFSFPLIQRRDVVNVEQVRRVEVGFRGQQRMPDEALMLTGDENIVEAQIIVQYRVSDTSKYLFRLKDPDETLRATAEVALRSMVGQTQIDELLTTGRERVQDEARAWLQKLMNDYQSGITVTELKLQTVDAPAQVREAFHDVVRAREEKEKLINEARGYQADVIPRAKGEAEKLQREAEAYREQRILRANGDANRFDATLVEFQKARARDAPAALARGRRARARQHRKQGVRGRGRGQERRGRPTAAHAGRRRSGGRQAVTRWLALDRARARDALVERRHHRRARRSRS